MDENHQDTATDRESDIVAQLEQYDIAVLEAVLSILEESEAQSPPEQP